MASTVPRPGIAFPALKRTRNWTSALGAGFRPLPAEDLVFAALLNLNLRGRRGRHPVPGARSAVAAPGRGRRLQARRDGLPAGLNSSLTVAVQRVSTRPGTTQLTCTS